MMGRRPMPGASQEASTSYTFTAAGSETESASLPQGMVGKPIYIKASGSVSGAVKLTFGNGAQKVVPVNPNAPYNEVAVPASAFPAPTNSVSLTLEADGAGVIRAVVGFQ